MSTQTRFFTETKNNILPAIEVENLYKSYEEHEILKNINFKIFSTFRFSVAAELMF